MSIQHQTEPNSDLRSSGLLAELELITGSGGVVSGPEVQLKTVDWIARTPCEALAIVRPKTTEQLSKVLEMCHANEQALVPAGGLTGLVQGTVAASSELLLSVERMNQIEAIDPIGRTITVQSGTPLQTIQEAAAEYDLLFPVDLGARGSATAGGIISTNAGGNQVIRYGMMRGQVLGLEAVLADGTVISSMNRVLKNNSGYDLKHLFIGSEGTLGIVTKAVLRLVPKPKSTNTAIVAASAFSDVTDFFQKVGQNLNDTLTAFEVMWREHYELVAIESGRHKAPIPGGYEYYIVLEMCGPSIEHDRFAFDCVLEEALGANLIKDAVVANSIAQRDAIWAIREDIEALAEASQSGGCAFDVSLPIDQMEAYVDQVRQSIEAKWPATNRVLVFGHIGDGNIHFAIGVHPWSDAVHSEVEEIVYLPLKNIGGAISAEHGVGLEKKRFLHVSKSADEIELMRTLKRALDPKNILNPGKVIPHVTN